MRRSPFLDGALAWVYDNDVPDACPQCGYSWDIAAADALSLIGSSPDRIAAALEDRDGMVAVPDGSWNATAYVWHLADLARSWSERWVQIRFAPGSRLVGFDPDELAAARGYRSLPTEPALWALRTAVTTLLETTNALPLDTTFEHGDWGTGAVGDAMIWLGHEVHHHEQDIAERAR